MEETHQFFGQAWFHQEHTPKEKRVLTSKIRKSKEIKQQINLKLYHVLTHDKVIAIKWTSQVKEVEKWKGILWPVKYKKEQTKMVKTNGKKFSRI